MSSRAFSLVELIIVVAIVSVIYLIGFGISLPNSSDNSVNIFKMKSFLVQNFGYEIELVCIDECKKCFIDSGTEIKEIEQNFNLSQNTKIYLIDKNYNEYRSEYLNFKDKEVCFRYKISQKGLSEPLIIESGDKFFVLSSFLGRVKSFTSISEAKDWYLKSEYDLEELY